MDDDTPHFISDEDLEDADDILFAHLPTQKIICSCGEDYPCHDLRFARLVRSAHAVEEAG